MIDNDEINNTNGDTNHCNTKLITSDFKNNFEVDNSDVLLTITCKNNKILRDLKSDIEEKIISKLRKYIEADEKNEIISGDLNKKVTFHTEFMIDKMGSSIKTGETGICEGWKIPKYENEFQQLLALPRTEDTPSETMRMKKPGNECFNCLATTHKISECPIPLDKERIEMHRKTFASQSHAAHEQAQLFSNRYTNDLNDGEYRGFTPGKISDNLREALGLRKNQLPPYIYMMRELGYPIGWLLEAQVKLSGISVLDGKESNTELESGELENEKNEEPRSTSPIYDPDKILDYPGLNQPIPEGFLDETQVYGVRRYNDTMSKAKFVRKLKVAEVPKKVKLRKSSTHTLVSKDSQQRTSSSDQSPSQSVTFSLGQEQDNTQNQSQTDVSITSVDETANSDDKQDQSSLFLTPHKNTDILGTSLTEIPGTPIVINNSGVNLVPGTDKFSVGICQHKPYEMLSNSTGQYQTIIELTRKFRNNTSDDDDNYTNNKNDDSNWY